MWIKEIEVMNMLKLFVQHIWCEVDICLCLSPDRTMIQRLIMVGIRGGEGRAQAKAQALLDYAGHRPT